MHATAPDIFSSIDIVPLVHTLEHGHQDILCFFMKEFIKLNISPMVLVRLQINSLLQQIIHVWYTGASQLTMRLPSDKPTISLIRYDKLVNKQIITITKYQY